MIQKAKERQQQKMSGTGGFHTLPPHCCHTLIVPSVQRRCAHGSKTRLRLTPTHLPFAVVVTSRIGRTFRDAGGAEECRASSSRRLYIFSSLRLQMATPIIAGMAVAGAAYATRAAMLAWRGVMARGGGAAAARFPRAFAGGFESEMTRREALLILGLRDTASKDAIRDAHRRLMRLNHPDNGGSTFVATKVNEAKDILISGRKGGRVI
jgi:DnaJ homolog subfamily C member 19